MRGQGGLAIFGCLVLLSALLGSPAEAHLPGSVTSFYVYSSSACSKQTEPVTIVFRTYANSSRSANHFQKHTGWTPATGSAVNTRYFKGHDYSCVVQNWQRAAGTSSSHWHARARTLHLSSSTDVTTLASAHLEVLKACGHAVKAPSGFDTGREQIYTKFGGAAGLADHTSPQVNWGNSRNFLQCDNAYAGSNGKVYSIKIPKTLHPLP